MLLKRIWQQFCSTNIYNAKFTFWPRSGYRWSRFTQIHIFETYTAIFFIWHPYREIHFLVTKWPPVVQICTKETFLECTLHYLWFDTHIVISLLWSWSGQCLKYTTSTTTLNVTRKNEAMKLYLNHLFFYCNSNINGMATSFFCEMKNQMVSFYSSKNDCQRKWVKIMNFTRECRLLSSTE